MTTALPFLHPRDEILATIARIYRYRMTTTSGGNISIREPNGDIWITPARLDKGSLRREDIVQVRADGTVEGLHRPSSEFPFHLAIYLARPDLRGIVHAHSVALVAFSMVHRVPDTRLFHQAQSVCGNVGFAKYELPGSEALGASVAAIFQQGCESVILENHGVVTGGVSLRDAFHRFETLEFAGKTIIKGSMLGEVKYLDDASLQLPSERSTDMERFERTEISSAEKEARRGLCEFVQRAYRQRLIISTQGSFSVRLDDRSFVMTPYRVDRSTLAPEELVLIQDGKAEAGALPSRAAHMHDSIYKQHSEVKAIINAYPVNATAFSVTGSRLDSHTIPESYVVLRNVGQARYGLQFTGIEELTGLITDMSPSLLLENDGVLVTGKSMLEAFDRLEVMESTAEAIINSKSIGALSNMPAEVIRDLDRVFLGRN